MTSVADVTALSWGDRNRNERLARLRMLLPAESAIVGGGLAAMITGRWPR